MPFRRPSLPDLIARARAELGPQPLRRSVESVLSRVLPGAAHGLHGHVAWLGRQVMPDRVTGAQLDRWARMYQIDRRRAAKATGYGIFVVAGSETIPVAHRLRDVYGHTYVVTESEPYSIPGFAIVAIEAEETGSAQNLAFEEPLHLLTPIAGVTSPGSVAGDLDIFEVGLADGADDETDRELRGRLLARMGRQPRGGSPGDYAALALEAGALMAWEKVEEAGAGTVTVYVADLTGEVAGVDPGGQLATVGSAELALFQQHLDDHAPITIDVTVSSVAVSTPSMTVAITPDTADIREQVELELRALFLREALAQGPGLTIPRSRIDEAVSLAEGLTSHVVTIPASSWTAAAGTVIRTASITWV